MNDLQAGKQRVADERRAAQAWIFQAEHAALGFLLADQAAGADRCGRTSA